MLAVGIAIGVIAATTASGARLDLRAQADAIMSKDYKSFIAYKSNTATRPAAFDWSDDGCSGPPGIKNAYRSLFDKPCQIHDFGYRNYGNWLRLSRNENTRSWIDDRFESEMVRLCNNTFTKWWQKANKVACVEEAGVMWSVVRGYFGRNAFYGTKVAPPSKPTPTTPTSTAPTSTTPTPPTTTPTSTTATTTPQSPGGPPASASVSNNGGQVALQLNNFPLGTTYWFCHVGDGYPTGGAIANHGQFNVTSPNQSFPTGFCSGSGNFWIGLQATDGRDYYSNQVTFAPASPASASVSDNGGQVALQLTNFPLGTTYWFCHVGDGYPTGGAIANHGQFNVTSPNQSFPTGLCSGTGNFWIGLQATDGHDYYTNVITFAPPSPSVTVWNSGGQLGVQLNNFPLGVTYWFCHVGGGYPTGGAIANRGQFNVTSPNQSFSSGFCGGSGNFWIGLQARDGHDYYSNQVGL
jgi:hypothetical protein